MNARTPWILLIKYSPSTLLLANTHGCKTTEFGFATNIPQPAPVEDLGGGIPLAVNGFIANRISYMELFNFAIHL